MTIIVEMNSEEFLEFTKFQEEKRIDKTKLRTAERKYYEICKNLWNAYGVNGFELKDINFAELQAMAYPELLKEALEAAFEELND